MNFSNYWYTSSWIIDMPSFDYLKDVISFSVRKCDKKTGIKKVTSEEKHQSFRINFETFKIAKTK